MKVTSEVKKMMIPNDLLSLDEATELINRNNHLTIAGSEKALKQLPAGNWIGGTIPYFMSTEGGVFTDKKVFVSDITKYAEEIKITAYPENTIENIPGDAFNNGFVYLIIPGLSDIHAQYSLKTHSMDNLMEKPIFGWISGFDLNKFNTDTAKVINGQTLEFLDNAAIAMHCKLPKGKHASIDIVNIFEQDSEADLITFEEAGFEAKSCMINGKKANLFDYINTKQIDTKLPLVANYSGASINIGIQTLDEDSKITKFYAPVQPGAEYRFAKPIKNYITEFEHQVDSIDKQNIALSCNCVLNYLYSELNGKQINGFYGPFTFGEIAYILVNQTLVYLSIED